MISVAEAQALCLDRLTQLGTEAVALRHAAGRTLAAPAVADRDQPPLRHPRWMAMPCRAMT